jgi:hypothetical protein
MQEGSRYYEATRKVETWMGYCHGWSPASFMMARPTQAISVLAADGRTVIPFYPDDIKALATLLWAKGYTSVKHISSRCHAKLPPDGDRRITQPECLDTNPGTWHLSLVNQIGVSRRSFIFDKTYDYEVWTHPLLSYKYSYFNPVTKIVTDSLSEATVPIQSFQNDPFSQYRSNQTSYVAGVALEFTYLTETAPSHSNNDTSNEDSRIAMRYIYDLELDSDQRIIGGEWYHNAHPDFLFVPARNSRAYSFGDPLLDSWLAPRWDGNGPVPQLWTRAALTSSVRGQPLASVVETLINRSR